MARIPGRQYYPNGRIRPLPRDYKAEDRRRNLLAWSRDHGTRAKQRRKIEKGIIAPFQPKRVRKAETIKAQELRLEGITKRKVPSRSASMSDRDDAYDWSAMHAQTYMAQYLPEVASLLGVSRYEYTRIYLNAWVRGDYRYTENRYDGGTDAMGEWFVNLNNFMSASEYEDRYAIR